MRIPSARAGCRLAWPIVAVVALAGCQASPSPTGSSAIAVATVAPTAGATDPAASGAVGTPLLPPASDGTSVPTLDPGAIDRATQQIEATDPADEATIDAAARWRFTAVGVAAAGSVLASS